MADSKTDYRNYSQAKHEGLRFYMGQPCAVHGDSPRYVVSKACVQCAKDRRKKAVANNPHYERDIKRRQKERAESGEARTALNPSTFEELL